MTPKEDVVAYLETLRATTTAIEAKDAPEIKFGVLVDKGMQMLSMSDREMADEFEAAISTVGRWRKMVTEPRQGMKLAALRFLENRVKGQLL